MALNPRVTQQVSIVVLLAWASAAGTLAAHEPKANYNSQAETVKPLSPAAALAALRLPDGFRATLFAAEPEIQQPIGMTTDARGRLWVAENYTYAEARVGFDDALKDRILILEDADRDGTAEKRTLFWDQGNRLTSVAVGFGGVWAMCPPRLLFIPDEDGDDVPDAEPTVMLDGFELGSSSHHNFANGLKWGPDGWLYGRVGIAAPARIGGPGTPSNERVDVGASIWRYHPVTKQVEEVCTGGTNSWGHDWDRHGELFFINTVIGHLWHGVPGAHFRRMYGADRNPHVYDIIEQTADHFHWDSAESWGDAKKGVSSSTDKAGGGHAHTGMIIYQGGNWPAEYRNKLYTVNMHGMRINSDRIDRAGATYVGKHDADFLKSDDPYFRGVELLTAADGGVFLADWSDIGECHENDGVHRSSGRIYKITHGEPKTAEPIDRQTPTLALARLQLSKSEWHARNARRLLQERAAAGEAMAATHEALRKMFVDEDDVEIKLRALWSLHVSGGLDETFLIDQLGHADEHIRAWAVRLLVEDRQLPPAAGKRFAEMAKSDASGLVLVYLASALQRMPAADRWAIATPLATRTEFASDGVFPLMLWYGIEAAVPQQPAAAVKLASASDLPIIRQYVARRVTHAILDDPAGVEALVAAIQSAEDPDRRRDLLSGMAQAMAGWRQASPPGNWAELQRNITAGGDRQAEELVQRISVIFGDGQAVGQLMQVVADNSRDLAVRQNALRSLIEAKADGLRPLLEKLLDDRDLAGSAAQGLAAFDDPKVADLIVRKYGGLRGAAREQAIGALVGRPGSVQAMLEAVERGQIDRATVAPYHIRQMQGYDDPRIQEGLLRLWPDLRPISADKRARIVALKASLTPDELAAANLAGGRKLWEATCAKCHLLHGTGGKIGPDLTGAQRHNLDYLLENIVDPSATLAANFRLSTIAMIDGRVIQGVVLLKSDPTWQVQTATELVSLNAADIDEAQETRLSLMPEGMLDVLKPAEVRDLIAYLMSNRTAAP